MEPRRRLVSTSELAREIGLSTRLIQQYRQRGLLTPADETPVGGHARWDVEDVKRQLRELREQRARRSTES